MINLSRKRILSTYADNGQAYLAVDDNLTLRLTPEQAHNIFENCNYEVVDYEEDGILITVNNKK